MAVSGVVVDSAAPASHGHRSRGFRTERRAGSATSRSATHECDCDALDIALVADERDNGGLLTKQGIATYSMPAHDAITSNVPCSPGEDRAAGPGAPKNVCK